MQGFRGGASIRAGAQGLAVNRHHALDHLLKRCHPGGEGPLQCPGIHKPEKPAESLGRRNARGKGQKPAQPAFKLAANALDIIEIIRPAQNANQGCQQHFVKRIAYHPGYAVFGNVTDTGQETCCRHRLGSFNPNRIQYG